jgi:hypothetical protein
MGLDKDYGYLPFSQLSPKSAIKLPIIISIFPTDLGEVARNDGGDRVKKQSYLTAALSVSQNLRQQAESYEMGTTLAAWSPLGPSSTENSTF